MFKKNYTILQVLDAGAAQAGPATSANIAGSGCCLHFGFRLCLRCHTVPPLPPVNLTEPGWTVLQGQAVWRTKKDAPEIAGELFVATNPDGRSFVQFTKTPLPFVVAQTTTNSWQIHFVPNDKTYSGRGKVPPSQN